MLPRVLPGFRETYRGFKLYLVEDLTTGTPSARNCRPRLENNREWDGSRLLIADRDVVILMRRPFDAQGER
jgi:hypothetical protein